MSNVEQLFLSKVLSKLVKDVHPTVGQHMIDKTLTVKLNGVLTKGEDYERDATVSIPFKVAMQLFVDRVRGIVQINQIDKVFEILVESLVDSMDDPKEKVQNIEGLTNDLEKAESIVKERLIGKIPKQQVSGSTTIKGTIEFLQEIKV